MFSNKNNQILLGIAMAIGVILIVVMGYNATPAGSALNTFFFALGGKMPEGLIQMAAFACFFICLLGMRSIATRLEVERKAYDAKLLPETEQFVLYPEDVNRIKLETIDLERRAGSTMLTDLIKQATTKFRSHNSPAEALTIVETMSDMHRKSLEKDFWVVSTCQTLIPMFGFLGTVWGMASTVMSMGKPQSMASSEMGAKPVVSAAPQNAITADDIQVIIDKMGSAFFATIVAMALAIIVNILLKRLEAQAEDLHTGLKRYVVENLINRISL
jgi:biopolymer transport protein ExbB/TolQ